MAEKKKDFTVVGSFPSPFYPKEVKASNDYGIQYAKSLFAVFAGKDQQLLNNRKQRIQYLRRLRMGLQHSHEFLDLAKDDDANTYANLDLAPPSVIPKFTEILVNKILRQDYYVKLTASDSHSLKVKQAFKEEAIKRIFIYHTLKNVAAENGIDAEPVPPPFATPDDLEVHMMSDFKLSTEIASEKGVDFIMNSQHDYQEILRNVLNDLVTADLACTKTDYCSDGSVKLRWVDVENVVYSFSNEGDFRKIQHAGELVVMTISELRKRATDLHEDDIKKIAQSVAGKNNNPDRYSSTASYNQFNQPYYEYDSFQVTVLDFQFLSTCELVYEKKETKDGYSRIVKRDESYELPKNSKYKRELKKKHYTAKFGGYFVLGTEYIFGYGEKTSPLRKANNLFETEIDYTFYSTTWNKGQSYSFVQKIEPYAKQMANAHVKLQQMIAKARPNGVTIDIGGLKQIDLHGTGSQASPLDLQAVYDQTGNFYWNSMDEDGETMNRFPMQELANGVSVNGIRALIEIYNFNLQIIRDVTGLNEFTDASTPSSEALVGIQQAAQESSNNATYGVDLAWKNITKRTAMKVLLCLQESIRKNKGIYADVIGEASEEVLDIINRFPKQTFLIDIELAPTRDEKIMLEQAMGRALEQQTLTFEDMYLIRNAKNFKVAQVLLGIKTRRNMERMRAEQQEDMQMKSQLDQQSAMVANQAKQETISIEMQRDMTVINAKHLSQKALLSLTNELVMTRDKQKFAHEKEIATLTVGQKMEMQDFMENRRDERQRQGKSMDSEMIEQRKKNTEAKDFTTETPQKPTTSNAPDIPSADADEQDFTDFMNNYVSGDGFEPEINDPADNQEMGMDAEMEGAEMA